jgi:glyoxylase-like metal-dependent hydrolase (beta-lactamase superfamily II)
MPAEPGLAQGVLGESGFPIRVLAPNPGPFTLEGTNTWILGAGTGRALVIDPGPDDATHLEEVRRTAGSIGAILLTHRHPDHAPGARALASATDAPVLSFAPADGEHSIADGQVVMAGGAEVRVLHTPGHTPDHVVFHLEASGILFTGDAVLGRGTSVIDPPEGDLTAYLGSLERMRALEPRVICPGHGPVVWDAEAKLDEYLEHRAERERQIVEGLGEGPATAEELVPAIYGDYPPHIHSAAARSVLAHLIALERAGRATRDGDRFALASAAAGGPEDGGNQDVARPSSERSSSV